MTALRQQLIGTLIIMTSAIMSPAHRPFVTHVDELNDPEKADWIAPPDTQLDREGLYLFRKTFELEATRESFVLHISADPRYKLFVNGAFVTMGPALGDLQEWRYETVDIAGYLEVGRNLIAVELWDAGRQGGHRQATMRTALIVDAPDADDGPIRTDGSWRVLRSRGWSALPMDSRTVGGGYIAGATERLDASTHPWGWNMDVNFDDTHWAAAVPVGKGNHGGLDTWAGSPWILRERPIPLLEMRPETPGDARAAWINDRQVDAPKEWPLQVEPNTTLRVLFDRSIIAVGFPRLSLRGGAGGKVRVRYQEALFQPGRGKGNRNEIDGKVMRGYFDELVLDGSAFTFEPAWLRTYRYLELTVTTAGEPASVEQLDFLRVRYPFEVVGAFESSDASLREILEASWHTADVCALETYMDCPYYEQVQYVGDTRIQALISLYMTGDDRLMRNAIMQFHRSRQYHGLTASSFPVRTNIPPQIIPPFSLLYVSMVHDFHMHRNDPEFVRPLLPGIRYTLEWFLARIDERGLLGPLPYWNHTDGGAQGFRHGSPPGVSTGGSIQITLLLIAALDEAADLFESHGLESDATEFRAAANHSRQAVNRYGFDEEKGLYAETPQKEVFSQHTNAYAILTNTAPKEIHGVLAEKLVTDRELTQATLYFQFYIFNALREAGRGDLILKELDRWREMLDAGLTTFPEHGLESRSDAHAWSAHPLYHLLASTAGIRPAEAGFKSVIVEPAPGDLEWFNAKACHPAGLIEVQLNKLDDRFEVSISLPDGVSGELRWRGKTVPLRPGQQTWREDRDGVR